MPIEQTGHAFKHEHEAWLRDISHEILGTVFKQKA